MTEGPRPPRFGPGELGRFLEIQTLGLNLPFAVAFLLVAAQGLPTLRTFLLVVLAFVAARNAGHGFNRWADRELDAANPRTQDRALPRGLLSPAAALAIAVASGAVLVAAAYFLNPLAFLLSPVALALVYGYSYTKRFTSLTTVFLGLVQAAGPAAVYIAVRGTLPLEALVAVAALLAWGTAFETIHSLGDLASDRSLGLRSLPLRLGIGGGVRLVVLLHAGALALLALYGWLAHLGVAYDVALAGMAALLAFTDRSLAQHPERARIPFERHIALSLAYLAGVVVAVFLPALG